MSYLRRPVCRTFKFKYLARPKGSTGPMRPTVIVGAALNEAAAKINADDFVCTHYEVATAQ